MVLQCEVYRDQQEKKNADIGPQKELAIAVIPVPFGMTHPGKPSLSTDLGVLRAKKAKIKVVAPLPEEGKEREERKVKEEIQADLVAVKTAAV